MGKKNIGINSKAQEAREREATKKKFVCLLCFKKDFYSLNL